MIGLRTHNVIRRHPVAGVIAAIMVLFVPLFFLLFMQMESVLHEEDYLNKSDYVAPEADSLRLSPQYTTHLIIVAVAAALVPLIELLNYFSKPLKLRTLKAAATSIAATNGTADRSHNGWWKLYHYFFAHMSKSAALGFLVWAVWNVASFALVCSHYYKDKEHFDWPFSSYYAQEYNGFVPSTADKWVYMFGIAAIPPLLLNYFLTLLPAARTSSLLSIIGLSYEESMQFHKLTGFAAAFWAVVHGVFCQAPTANVPNGAKWAWIQWWDPKYAPSQWVWWGQVAMFLQAFIVVCSLKWVRMKKYWTFRIVHLLFPFVLATTSAHYYSFYFYTQPGVILLLADGAARITFAVSKSTVTLNSQKASKSEEVVTLRVPSPFNPATTARDKLYGRFFYLQLPDISQISWHPMTMTDFKDGILTFVIKVNGEESDDIWTRNLQTLAHSGGSKNYPIRLEGPYGYDFVSAVVDRVLAQGTVVFIAGGSGIAPFTAALSYMASSDQLRPLLRSVHMVWSAKNYATLAAFEPSLRAAVAAGAHITAHCTGTSGTIMIANTKTSSSSAVVAPIDDVPSSGHTSRSGSDTTMAASTATATTAKLSSSTATARPKKRKFWQPASPLYRWFVGCVLVYLSILGNTAGWFLGRLCTGEDYDQAYPARIERLAKLEVAYNATVSTNYAAATGTTLKAGEWPEGQAQFTDFYIYEQWFFGGMEEVIYCYPMNGTPDRTVAAWQYGQPVPCVGASWDAWTAQGFIWSLFSWLFGAVLTISAGYMFRRQREAYDKQASPLMTGVTPVKQLNSSTTTATAATAALTDDSAFCFTVTTGRPALGPYLASIVQHTSAAAATGRQATGTAAAAVAPIDVYVSGPEALQQGARLSYDRRIKPAVRGSSFLPLSYTIG